jgi:integrase
MQERGRSVRSVRNDISEMSAIWKHAIRNDILPSGSNPFEGISPPKQEGNKKKRRPFTDEEATTILTTARQNRGYIRWLPWVCCLTGARISEICPASAEDVSQIEGVTVLCIHDEGAEDEDGVSSLKNEESRRIVPIHLALVAEGFLDFVNRLPARSPLFPDARSDALFGLRATNASKKVARCLKKELKITDPKITPNHSWRHWFIDARRQTGTSLEVCSALTGHRAKFDESAGYAGGTGSLVNTLAEAIAKVIPPISPL